MGRDETPFFGSPKKEKRGERRKKYVILRSAERRACGVVGRVWRVGLRFSRLSFALRRLGAAGGTITLRYYYRITNARLLRRAGVGAEVKKVGSRDIWYVEATADMLAAGRGELRKAIAEVVREAIARGWVDTGRAEGWLKKLEEGRVLMEGWPKYKVGLTSSGALEVRFSSLNPDNIERGRRGLGRWASWRASISR